MKNKVSVIIPIYNSALVLSRCLDSILCQTYRNIEVILVDDCSLDQSRRIMERYAEIDKRIKCIYSYQNGGAAYARNLGLDAATGDFIMFADSDDYVVEDWIYRLINAQSVYNKCMVMTNIYDCAGAESVARMNEYDSSQVVEKDFFTLFSRLHLDGYLVNKIFDRSTIEENGLRFNASIRVGEDVDFIFRYLTKKEYHRFYLIEKPLYYYRRDSELSVTNSFNPNALSENLHCFKCRLPYISDNNLTEFCDIYFSYLYGMLNNAFDCRGNKSFMAAMRYNNQIVSSPVFRKLVEHSKQGKSKTLLMKVVKTYNYYLIWIFQQLVACLK